MTLLLAITLLAQSSELPPGYVADPPSCPEGKTDCDPWARFRKPPPKPFDQFDEQPEPEKLGPGPHTLIVSAQQGLTRIDYPNGERCLRARNEIRRQTNPPPNGSGLIYAPSIVKAFCVPR